MNKVICYETLRYSKDTLNDQAITVTEDELAKFTGIHLFSGYHTVPRQHVYWCADEDISIPLITNMMSCNRFEAIKRHLHLADSINIDSTEKAARVRPIYTMLKSNLQQFGILSRDLSVDEQIMLPYVGRQAAKMYMSNKPVKFSYKFWVLSSSTGYPYNIMLYTGQVCLFVA